MRDLGKYLLWQTAGWLVVAAGLAWLVRVFEVPVWIAAAVLAVVVLRDLMLYPVLRSTLTRPPFRAAPIGVAGETVDPLPPSGYVRVNGELWQAELLDAGAQLPPGTRIIVRDARGLTLLVSAADPSR